METRKARRSSADARAHEKETKLADDEQSEAFAEGQEAAKETFGKLRDMLLQEKQNRA